MSVHSFEAAESDGVRSAAYGRRCMDEWRARVAAVTDALRCTRAEAAALTVLVIGTLVGLGAVWVLAQPAATPEQSATSEPAGGQPAGRPGRADRDDRAEPGQLLDDGEPVVVHVTGEVADPGVVEVPSGSRVGDAIDAAGGATADADLSVVNLARMVEDGEQIVVGHVDDPDGSGAAGAVGPKGKIDVNRADAATLQEVPGIGPVTAERLLSHRQEHGPFTSADDLLDVPGIGQRTLDRLVDHLRW